MNVDSIIFGGLSSVFTAAADPHNVDLGANISIMGMAVVFSGLMVLSIILFFLEGGVEKARKLIRSFSSKGQEPEEKSEKPDHKMTGEEAAAVCAALILYHRMHMTERRERLTFTSKAKKVSPWQLQGRIHRTGGFHG